MRRRRPLVEVSEIPEHLDMFIAANWADGPTEAAVDTWLYLRAEWIDTKSTFPLDLCDGDYFHGTGTAFLEARERWERDHETELPWPTRIPDDPFDPSMI